MTENQYEEAMQSYRALVRELDVIINGEEGAAQQASLCDVVAQIRKEWPIIQEQLDKVNQYKLQYLEAKASSDCLYMVWDELVRAGVINKAVPPMMIPEGVLSNLQQVTGWAKLLEQQLPSEKVRELKLEYGER